MQNLKLLGNDGLIMKEFYARLWNDVTIPLLLATEKTCLVMQLRVSQKQAVIKLIKKKRRDKRYIQNW